MDNAARGKVDKVEAFVQQMTQHEERGVEDDIMQDNPHNKQIQSLLGGYVQGKSNS